MSILQWNTRGIRAHRAELQLLTHLFSPSVLCLQETKLRPHDSFSFSGFLPVRFDLPPEAGTPAHGGVMLLLRDDLFYQPLVLTTTLQAVAVTLILPGFSFTLCSIYIPPCSPFAVAEFAHLVSQLPAPYLLLGDFNAHHPLWGSPRACARGNHLAGFFLTTNLSLLNTGEPTFISDSTGAFSHLDLSVCSAQLAHRFQWSVVSDTFSSDHFPCLISLLSHTFPSPRVSTWQIHRANWLLYSSLAVFDDRPFSEVDGIVAHFTSVVRSAAERAIPRSSSHPKRLPVPWWTDDCRSAIRARRAALRVFRRHPTLANLITFKQLRARARRIIRTSKRTSWIHFVESFNHFTPSSVVWDKLRRVTGKVSPLTIPGLRINNATIVSPSAVADTLGAAFAGNSSSSHYHPDFLSLKNRVESQVLSFSSINRECYNALFTMPELERAMGSSRPSAPGPDGVHLLMLQHLSAAGKRFLLQIYNRIWTTATFPSAWHEATIVPILKPGKDRHLPSSYRPISLTSCVCKVMERMIHGRLTWWLESQGLLTNVQCGFRRFRSTVDHLVSLSTHIMNAFLQKSQTVAVFFDLEKAYDTCWRYGILRTLHNWGIRGRLPHFIREFMKERVFRVRAGSVLSRVFTQENGVPQGSVLSVTLFAIAINPIVNCVPPGVSSSLFVDDFAIYCSSRRTCLLERRLKLCLDRLYTWSVETGFKFSTEKTVCINFWRRTAFLSPSLRLGPDVLPFVDETKFLGLIFDRKLSWSSHISYLKARCERSLNVLRVLSGTSWGADRTVLLRLYRSLVRSKLDYGCIVYSSAPPSIVNRLNTTHHRGIRLSIGAFPTSPVISLCAEAAEPPLSYRRDVLLSRYGCSLSSLRGHPSFTQFFNDSLDRQYSSHSLALRPPGVRFRLLLRQLDVTLPATFPMGETVFPPWLQPEAAVNLDLLSLPKSTTPASVLCSAFLVIKEQYGGCGFIYTDGSKDARGVGCAFIHGRHSFTFRLSPQCSIFPAELFGIYQAILYLQRNPLREWVLCSDSLSALQSIRSLYSYQPLVQRVQVCLHSLASVGVTLSFLWVPGHVGLPGSEAADAAAKAALLSPSCFSSCVPSADFSSFLHVSIISRWRVAWAGLQGNKLREVKPVPDTWSTSSRASRREEVILARLRIGHCRFSHAHLLSSDPAPDCAHCSEPLSVRHVLLRCPFLAPIRASLGLPSTLSEVLADAPSAADRVLSFIRHSGMGTRV